VRRWRRAATAAIARYAFPVYTEAFTGPSWLELADHGAAKQRLLWVSTSTKNPQYPDTRYVDQIAVHGAVNTMPLTTLEAVADHGRTDGDTVTGRAGLSAETLELLSGVGADVDDVYDTLEREGVDKFAAWRGVLHDRVQRMLDKARS
jgi:transaldolase